MTHVRKVALYVCYFQDYELRIRIFESPTEAHQFAREHEPANPGQTTIQVAAGDLRKLLSEILSAMNAEDRLDWALATVSQQ